MATTLKPVQSQILGMAIVEILNGELSDETIAAVDSIKRADVPEPLNNLVGMIHGMSTFGAVRQGNIGMMIDEIRIAAVEQLETRNDLRGAIRTEWIMLYSILKKIMDGSEFDIRGTANVLAEAGLELAEIDHSPAWTRPLLNHIKNSTSQGDELILELLNVLEAHIQKRRAELIT